MEFFIHYNYQDHHKKEIITDSAIQNVHIKVHNGSEKTAQSIKVALKYNYLDKFN